MFMTNAEFIALQTQHQLPTSDDEWEAAGYPVAPGTEVKVTSANNRVGNVVYVVGAYYAAVLLDSTDIERSTGVYHIHYLVPA